MSFFSAQKTAEEQGINIAALVAGNQADEHAAKMALDAAIPLDLPLAWKILAKIAPIVLEQGSAIDECLHCTVLGNGKLANAAGIGGLDIAKSDKDNAYKQLRRLGMFDYPRQLAAQVFGINVYWLFNNVYIISPASQPVDMDWAFQRHATRHLWGAAGLRAEPATLPAAEARAYVKGVLAATAPRELGYLLSLKGIPASQTGSWLPGGDDKLEDDDARVQETHACLGSLTGRAVLEELTGRTDWQYYNCCKGGVGPQNRPSAVLQLQNQQSELIDC